MTPILKNILKVLGLPFYSLVSNRIGFSILVPTFKRWWLYTRGKFIPIDSPPGLHSLEYFRYFVPKMGATVFDVGGERGLEAEQLSLMVGGTGKVYTFECFPEHIQHLRNLAKTLPNLVVVEKACWNESGTLSFYEGHTPGSNTAVSEAKGQLGQPLGNLNEVPLTVDSCTLDEMWSSETGEEEIDFMKMDIEGAELEALEGASNLLKHTKKVVVAAYHIRNGEVTASLVSDILRRAGFIVRTDENYHVYGIRKV